MFPAAARRIIIDLDVGSDDAFALLTLLYAEKIGKVKIEAIVCTMGNTYLHHVCLNVVRLLEIFERTDIPVYKGQSGPITPLPQELPQNFFFHGKDGFGDIIHEKDPDISIIKKVPASVAMNELTTNNPGEITLVCIGPLTNVAVTIKTFEKFASSLKDIYVFGGNYKGPGNITAAAEFNFYVDPEGANIVLTNNIAPVTLVTWETSLDTSINLDWRYKTLGKLKSPFIELLNKVEASIYKNATLDKSWITPDSFLVVAMLYPEAILEKITRAATVELHCKKTRGRILYTRSEKQKNVVIVTKIDAEIVKDVLLKAASSFS